MDVITDIATPPWPGERTRGDHRRLRRRARRPPGGDRPGAGAGRRARRPFGRAHVRPPPGHRRAPRVGAADPHRRGASASSCSPPPASTPPSCCPSTPRQASEPPESFIERVLVTALAGQGHRGRPRLPLRSQPHRPRRPAREVRPHARLRGSPDRAGARAPTGSTSRSARRRSAGRWPAATSTRAPQMLGRPYEVRGTVVMGDQRGRLLGFPTANVAVPNVDLPARRRRVRRVVRARPTASVHPCAINLGRRPTFYEHADASLLEAHLLDFSDDLYGEASRGALHALPAQRAQVRRDRGDRRPARRRRRPRPRAARRRRRPDDRRDSGSGEGGVEHGDELVGAVVLERNSKCEPSGRSAASSTRRFTQSANGSTSTSPRSAATSPMIAFEAVDPLRAAGCRGSVGLSPAVPTVRLMYGHSIQSTRDTPAATSRSTHRA